MNEETNSYLGFGYFFLFILVIVVVGSFLVYQEKHEKVKEVQVPMIENSVSENKKLDRTKDFIYYDKEDWIVKELSLAYKYPVINLDSEDARNVTTRLTTMVNQKKSSLLPMSAKPESVECASSYDIYQAEIVDFDVFSYQDYVTLVVYSSFYSCDSGISSILEMQSYPFSITTGERVSYEQLLKTYRTTFSEVTLLIRDALMESQTYVDGVPYIQIDETISLLEENKNYILFVDENGELVVKYIVKTNGVDYNDTISIS